MVNGIDQHARSHLMRVNRWDDRAVDNHIRDAFAVWQARSTIDWTLDLTLLTDAGVRLASPPSAEARRAIALERVDR
jgi:hypothetical protein